MWAMHVWEGLYGYARVCSGERRFSTALELPPHVTLLNPHKVKLYIFLTHIDQLTQTRTLCCLPVVSKSHWHLFHESSSVSEVSVQTWAYTRSINVPFLVSNVCLNILALFPSVCAFHKKRNAIDNKGHSQIQSTLVFSQAFTVLELLSEFLHCEAGGFELRNSLRACSFRKTLLKITEHGEWKSFMCYV